MLLRLQENFVSALVYAAGQSSAECLRAILKDDSINVNLTNMSSHRERCTPLMRAASQGSIECVAALLAVDNVDVNTQRGKVRGGVGCGEVCRAHRVMFWWSVRQQRANVRCKGGVSRVRGGTAGGRRNRRVRVEQSALPQ